MCKIGKCNGLRNILFKVIKMEKNYIFNKIPNHWEDGNKIQILTNKVQDNLLARYYFYFYVEVKI